MKILAWIAGVDLALLLTFGVTCWIVGRRLERQEERNGWGPRT